MKYTMLLSHLQLLIAASGAAAQSYWFSFGDSYTETGFNSGGTLPSHGNPLGNPTYPGRTNTGGPNWIDLMTTTNNNSEIFTYNYAFGGATVDPSIVPPYSSSVVSMKPQIEQQGIPQLGRVKGWTSDNTLFSFWIGINDIGAIYGSGNANANAGARNFFFATVPPVQRSPQQLAAGSQSNALEKTVISYYNAQLIKAVNNFKSSHGDVKTWVWDTQTIFNAILDNPRNYGFRDATSYGSGTDLFWGNAYHPSSSGHKYLAQAAAGVLAGTRW